MGFLAILIAVVALHHIWDRRRVRDAITAYGHTVESVRWVPLELRLSGGRVTTFRATWVAKDGSRWRCRVEARLFGELHLDEPEPLIDGAVTSAADDSRTVVGVRPRPRALWRFHAAVFGSAAFCGLLFGATYWTVPYRTISLPSSLYGPGLLALVAAAATLRWFFPDRKAAIVLTSAGSMVFVIAVRIVIDVAADATRHNLWPFEVAIAAFLGGACGTVGVLASAIARGVVRRLNSH